MLPPKCIGTKSDSLGLAIGDVDVIVAGNGLDYYVAEGRVDGGVRGEQYSLGLLYVL